MKHKITSLFMIICLLLSIMAVSVLGQDSYDLTNEDMVLVEPNVALDNDDINENTFFGRFKASLRGLFVQQTFIQEGEEATLFPSLEANNICSVQTASDSFLVYDGGVSATGVKVVSGSQCENGQFIRFIYDSPSYGKWMDVYAELWYKSDTFDLMDWTERDWSREDIFEMENAESLLYMYTCYECNYVPECKESDDVLDVDNKGTVEYLGEKSPDTCYSTTEVKEYFCNNNEPDATVIDCADNDGICQDGECVYVVGPTESCIESDDGKEYDVKGILATNEGAKNDVCTDKETLKEFFCDGKEFDSVEYKCGSGKECSAGKCVTKSSTSGGDVIDVTSVSGGAVTTSGGLPVLTTTSADTANKINYLNIALLVLLLVSILAGVFYYKKKGGRKR